MRLLSSCRSGNLTPSTLRNYHLWDEALHALGSWAAAHVLNEGKAGSAILDFIGALSIPLMLHPFGGVIHGIFFQGVLRHPAKDPGELWQTASEVCASHSRQRWVDV